MKRLLSSLIKSSSLAALFQSPKQQFLATQAWCPPSTRSGSIQKYHYSSTSVNSILSHRAGSLHPITVLSASLSSSSSTTASSSNNNNNNDSKMTETKQDEYVLPKVWVNDAENGGAFSKINRPTSGPTHDKELPVGKHPLQVYSLATPNGVKVTILLEELLELGITDAEYDAWLINIGNGDQFGSGFVDINPNSKIPAMVDHGADGGAPLRVFESGSILVYLAEKFGAFLPQNVRDRTECMNWLMWQMGSAPFVGGGFGHFFAYAPYKMEYPINRYTMETKRQLDVLDKHLAKNTYMVGEEYTIADIAIWSWYGQLALDKLYTNSYEFLDMASYTNVIRWAQSIADRPAVKRGRIVNRSFGPLEDQLWERHDASDFETKTQDKIQQQQQKDEEEAK